MTTKKKILDILNKQGEVRPAELLLALSISQQMLHRHIKDLLTQGAIEKIGKSPRVFYKITRALPKDSDPDVSLSQHDVIEANFLHITPVGKELTGIEAFVYWCRKRGFNINRMAKQYADIINKYANIRNRGLLDATKKIRDAFRGPINKLCVDKLFYVDFYALETFGKTKLGQKLLYAKQSQDRDSIREIADMIKSKVESLIKSEKVDAVLYVPPTVKRKIQFMRELESRLALSTPIIIVDKVIGDVAVPQKTLKNFEDRVENARASFMLRSRDHKFDTVLIIDDAVGSGASINEIACKLKKAGVAKRVIGIAVTGSLNNFDVISEV